MHLQLLAYVQLSSMPCRNEPARERVPAEADRATTNRNEQRRTLFVAWRRHATPTGRAVEQRAPARRDPVGPVQAFSSQTMTFYLSFHCALDWS